jgi:short-subunit dehydrogenase
MCPGFVRTDLFENMLLPEGRGKKEPPKWMTTSAEVVARKSIRTIEKNRRLTTVTAFAKLGYYLERISPWLADSIYQFQRKKLHDFAIKAQEKTPEHITSVSSK